MKWEEKPKSTESALICLYMPFLLGINSTSFPHCIISFGKTEVILVSGPIVEAGSPCLTESQVEFPDIWNQDRNLFENITPIPVKRLATLYIG